jgi:hypothetical protein
LGDKRFISFEPAKNKELLISLKPDYQSNPNVSMKQRTVNRVEEMRVIGVTYDRRFTFDTHISKLQSKARQKIGLMRRLSVYLPKKHLGIISKSHVRPTMEYANMAFASAAASHHQKLQNIMDRAGKISGLMTTKLKKRTQAAAIGVAMKMIRKDAREPLLRFTPQFDQQTLRRSSRIEPAAGSNKLRSPNAASSLDLFRRSFACMVVETWNNIDVNMLEKAKAEGWRNPKEVQRSVVADVS